MTTPLTDVDTELEKRVKKIVAYGLSQLKTADGSGIMHMMTAEFVITEDFLALISTIAEQTELERNMLQESYDNLMEWMVKHPNDSLEDFMRCHVSSFVYDKRLASVTPAPEDGSANPEAPERLKDYMENNNG